MALSNTYWLQKAHQYADEHPAVREVSELRTDSAGWTMFDAQFEVSLPGASNKAGVTSKGVRHIEPVRYILPPTFPFSNPVVELRDDFNRTFPHINPNEKKVYPCVYEGSLGDLMQQPKWFDSVLDQTADWLNKAAADDLTNLSQGWEPTRLDRADGCVWYSDEHVKNEIQKFDLSTSGFVLWNDRCILAGAFSEPSRWKTSKEWTLVIGVARRDTATSTWAIPSSVSTFADLHSFAIKSGIKALKPMIDKQIGELAKARKPGFLVLVALKRPARLIGSTSDIEIHNFVVKTALNKKNGKISMTAPVRQLAHANVCTPELLAECSGIRLGSPVPIMQIGCGSLGSKIALHIARTGIGRFTLVDPAAFLPHNHARHALINDHSTLAGPKAELLAKSMNAMSIPATAVQQSILAGPPLDSCGGLVIDSTASVAVRNYLAATHCSGRLVNASLYGEGRMGVLVIEGKERAPRVDDLFCSLYAASLKDQRLHARLFTEQHQRVQVGQGCDSITVKCPDSRISLVAAGMAACLQTMLVSPFPVQGALRIGHVAEDDMSVAWETITEGAPTVLPATSDTDWEVRILSSVVEEMGRLTAAATPVETGGALIGHMSTSLKCLTVTGILPPPPDSIMKEDLFVLGTRGLRPAVRAIQDRTKGELTYLGTWHSHPQGGRASGTDQKTKMKLVVLRDYEPTVCLIWTPQGIIRV